MEIPDSIREMAVGNVSRIFGDTADRYPDQLALEMRGHELRFAELRGRIGTFAGGLHDLGLEPDDRMLVYLPNCPEYVVTMLGGFQAGVVPSPINPQYKVRELSHQMDDADVEAVVTHPALRETLAKTCREYDFDPTIITVGDSEDVRSEDYHFDEIAADPVVVDRDLDDVAMQPYTSGTTGTPKGVLTTHRNLRAQAFYGFGSSELPAEEQAALAALPLYHITGFIHSVWQLLVRGASVHLRSPANWDPEATMHTIEERGITSFTAVSTMYVDMVNHESFGDYDLTSLELAIEGGAKMPGPVQRTFEEATGVEISEGYGLTEATGATHSNVNTTFGIREGTVGQPIRMSDVKLVDEDGDEVFPGEEGELLVRGPHVTPGYHELPEATEAAFTDRGYFRTGDIARRDEDNYYEIIDRKKHMINTAGYNVYPAEVEELLFDHDAIQDAAVVGVPDERRNETVKAFVVRASDSDVTAEDIKEFCLEQIAEYKHPREVEFVDELPRTSSGKIQKFKLTD